MSCGHYNLKKGECNYDLHRRNGTAKERGSNAGKGNAVCGRRGWKIIVGLCGATLWTIGYNAKTSYSKTVKKGGKTFKVSYTPTKKLVKFGNLNCYVGNWALKTSSQTFNIVSGIKCFVKLYKK